MSISLCSHWAGIKTSVCIHICPYGTRLFTQPLLLLQMLGVIWSTAVKMLSSPCFPSSITSLRNIISCLYACLLSGTKTPRQANLAEIRWVDSHSCSNVFLIKCLFYSLFIHFPFPIQDQGGLEPIPACTGGEGRER